MIREDGRRRSRNVVVWRLESKGSVEVDDRKELAKEEERVDVDKSDDDGGSRVN
jgi:hypothetical protein